MSIEEMFEEEESPAWRCVRVVDIYSLDLIGLVLKNNLGCQWWKDAEISDSLAQLGVLARCARSYRSESPK